MRFRSPLNGGTNGGTAPARRSRKSQRGIALILVLAFLVLITALVVAFFSSVTTELSGAKGYASESNAKALANSAAQAVIGAIRQGTTGGTTVAWASQPGMIRTYDNTGKPVAYYKLYSSDNMAVTTFPFNPDSDVDSGWAAKTALYTDLNSPVISGANAIFPIIDGNSITTLTQTASGTTVPSYLGYNASGNGVPDIDGFAINTGGSTLVSGTLPGSYSPGSALSATNTPVPMPVKWIYVLKDGTLTAPTGVDSTGKIANWNGSSNPPTPTNPIVGRIAFWTDDDTCKINVNTASEGNFADTPRTQGVTDLGLAKYPTAQNEYQRYPGHPAMTCLSTVLGTLYPVNHALQPTVGSYYTSPNPASYAPYQPYYDIAPRLNVDTAGNQGSQAGTAVTSTNTAILAIPALQVKSDRLYASVDDFLFQSGTVGETSRPLNPPSTSGTPSMTTSLMQKAKFFLTADSRAPDVNLFNQPRVVTWPVCATTGSAYRTIFDSAMAFCGTVNGYPYYFQRQRNDHPTNDFPVTSSTSGLGRNRMIYQYLQSLTSQPIPGFGGIFGGTASGAYTPKYPNETVAGNSVSERDQILTEVFDYIRCLNLIDTSSTTTMTHPFAPVASGTNYPTTYAGTIGQGPTPTSAFTALAGEGQVVPIYDTVTHTKGFGRFPTIQEVALIFIATGWNDGNGGSSKDINYEGMGTSGTGVGYTTEFVTTSGTTYAPWGYYNPVTTGTFLATTPTSPTTVGNDNFEETTPLITGSNIQVQAALLISFFDPSQGNVWGVGTYSVQVTGLDNFTWTPAGGSAINMGFPIDSADISNMVSDEGQYTDCWGGNLGFRTFLDGDLIGGTVGSIKSGSAHYYPFISAAQNFPYNPPSSAGTFGFSGGTITLNLLLPSNTPSSTNGGFPLGTVSGRPIAQSITVSFPPATLPVPTYASSAVNAAGSGVRQDRGNFNNRFIIGSSNFAANCEFISGTNPTNYANGARGSDVVRSVRAYPGDIRMIAGLLSATDSATNSAASPGYFDSTETKIQAAGLPGWNYFSSSLDLVHSLRESIDYPFGGAVLGQLVPGVSYAGISNPFPSNYSGGLNTFSSGGNNATATGAMIGGGTNGLLGDWDNGFGYTADGPFINKPDEGNYNFNGGLPYFEETNYSVNTYSASQTYFSPNRLMPSPVMFGSLPSGVIRNVPWMTLLFCPNPASIASATGSGFHPGFGTASTTYGSSASPPYLPPYTVPPDHLLLDLFNMPVVEPYPITEPLSTSGRININYQIAPFTYITRNTGLRAVLKAERMTVIPDTAAGAYKNVGGTAFSGVSSSGGADYDFRVPINADQTLMAFDNYFMNNQDIFRSASQICDMFLYPSRDALLSSTTPALWDSANANITKFWQTHRMTGDNSRERPYATIYPRLTTKSNTFTIHMRVQSLKKAGNTGVATWNDTQDVVTSEYRGSETVERYVDPNDPGLPDFTTSPNTPLDAYYKFRVTNSQQFAP